MILSAVVFSLVLLFIPTSLLNLTAKGLYCVKDLKSIIPALKCLCSCAMEHE